jgi:3-methyladenine DNA glycosylase AlkD
MDRQKIERRVSKVQHGFKQMKEEAFTVVSESSVFGAFAAAKELYGSDKYQVRMVAVFIFGFIASKSQDAFKFLRKTVSKDNSWQVQEILAQAFNEFCKSLGYEKTLPEIKDWLADKNPNVRRAASEGLRIWNQREYFKEHPDVAVRLLANLRDDESEYVRRSAGNAIRDISRKEKTLVKNELSKWDTANPKIEYTYSLASKFL